MANLILKCAKTFEYLYALLKVVSGISLHPTKDQLLKDGFVVNTILKEADLFCPNSVRIKFAIYFMIL
ncbi:hypothetical protein GBO79_09550 [Pediococcus pentosaceus]|uniref:Uncharacterized protein n=1 Tax=Pediococcus pentosaceus TaxID=1255 RepID=A0ABQ6XET1_PEDPE|nr:hypothetical protein GBO79_09550 [Pediococcus pentosaceus]